MNALRRLCLAIYSLLLIAAAGALMALAWADKDQINWTVGGWNFQALINASDAAKIVFTIIMAAVALIGLLTLLMAVYRESVGARRGQLRLRQADGGMIEVSDHAIETLLRDELERYPDVRSVEPRVRLVGGAVDTTLYATIASSANIATVTSTLAQGVTNILRDQVGVTNVRRPEIRISQDESRGVGAPASSSSVAAAPSYTPPPPPGPSSAGANSSPASASASTESAPLPPPPSPPDAPHERPQWTGDVPDAHD